MGLVNGLRAAMRAFREATKPEKASSEEFVIDRPPAPKCLRRSRAPNWRPPHDGTGESGHQVYV